MFKDPGYLNFGFCILDACNFNYHMKNIILSLFTFLLTCPLLSQTLESFSLSAVTLHDSPFYQAEQTDLKYILALEPDRLLAPFLKDAGLEPKAPGYGNWEGSGLDGHIGGHYLTALAQMVAVTGNEEVAQRLNYMIDQLAACQEKNGNGYVGGIPNGQTMWKEIKVGNIRAAAFSLNDRWVPLYNIHKLYAGLRDAYTIAGNEKALEVLVKLSDWFIQLTEGLSDEQIQDMLRSEHGGLNEVFADVSAITGQDKYMTLARRLSHLAILEPLLSENDELTGLHANTQIPKVIGYKRIADLTDDETWSEAAAFFWENVVEQRSVSIGGNSIREHFNPIDDFSEMVVTNQGPETCNTYNMLRLSKLLFLSDPKAEYMDFYERALYNHILASQHPDGGFVYFTPMRPRHYRVYSQPDEGMWCCVGSGLENHGKYGEMIYAHDEQDLYVNLFIPSTLNWTQKGITLKQTTEFPFSETTAFELQLNKPQKFNLHFRYPSWVRTGELVVTLNGKTKKVKATPGSYFSLRRKWRNGDRISLRLPMHTQLEYLPDNSPWASFIYGPIVLAAATGDDQLKGLQADDSRMGHVADGAFYPIETAPLLVKKQDDILAGIKAVPGRPLTFKAEELIYPATSRDLELVPFFQLHDTRYMLYWQVTTPKNLEKLQQELRVRERNQLTLAARTIDEVAAGEQQPETEHRFKGEDTQLGSTNGKSWRIAGGWFSYELKNQEKEGKVLRIYYLPGRQESSFQLNLNGKPFDTVKLPVNPEAEIAHVDLNIPDIFLESGTEEKLEVKFTVPEDGSTGRIFQVLLLKPE